MSGAWEQPNASVLAAVLHTDTATVAWAFGVRNLILPGQFIGLAGMPYDMSRNTACMRAIEVGASHLFFLDSDVIPPRDAVLKLLAHRQPFISGLYCRRSPPVGVPVMIKNGQWVTEFKQGSTIEVDMVGAGCLLLETNFLLSIPPQRPSKHWFDWRVDMQGLLPPAECLSEDFTLCMHAKKHGYKVLMDTSVICRHIGFGQSTYGKFEALDSTPIT